jgi:hypothetical protein
MDSVSTFTGSSSTAMYLAGPLAVNNIVVPNNNYTAYLDNNTLVVTGSFESNKGYEVALYNIIGTKMFSERFIADNNSERFDLNRQIIPGMYIVSIAPENNPDSKNVIKVIKQ